MNKNKDSLLCFLQKANENDVFENTQSLNLTINSAIETHEEEGGTYNDIEDRNELSSNFDQHKSIASNEVELALEADENKVPCPCIRNEA